MSVKRYRNALYGRTRNDGTIGLRVVGSKRLPVHGTFGSENARGNDGAHDSDDVRSNEGVFYEWPIRPGCT